MLLKSIKSPRTVALLGVLTALCLAVQLSPRPPNVEFTSLFTFTVGFLFGPFIGVVFGGFVMFVNGFVSPWGFAGLNMPFQIVGMVVIGLAGGLYAGHVKNCKPTRFFIEAAVLGAFLTELYDLITNFGVAFSNIIIGMSPALAVATALAYGAPFSLIHVFSNISVFGVIFLPLVKTIDNVSMVKKIG